MADVYSVTFTGRLTRDAVNKIVGSTSVTEFDVANNFGYGDKAGVQYRKCSLWGKRGDALKQYLTKGQLVCVSGQETTNSWTDKDGVKRNDIVINVSDVALLGGKKDDNDPPPPDDVPEF